MGTPVVQPTGARPKDPKSASFLERVESMFNDVLRYEDESLQKLTKQIVPVKKLKLGAIKRMRTLQMDIKSKKLDKNSDQNSTASEENKTTIEDFLMVELLDWFKNEFFSWVNTMICSFCSASCKYNRTEFKRDPKLSRIEIHKCDLCGTEEEFPRYTDPRILLTTRRGRCGEWANAFTLICRSLGYDARLVHDETDHVWTEIWCIATNRWIHVDPCENVIDRPLLYEKGWKKNLTYVIAYSKDEIQDVTWRYTRDQETVMKRRNHCTEEALSTLIWCLNEERQTSPGYSAARKRFVVKRRLMELVELLQPPPGTILEDDDGNEYGGRSSGDAAWRIARGELSVESQSSVWQIPKSTNKFDLYFFVVRDVYETFDASNKLVERKHGWEEGLDSRENIFRKVENDWKIVYISRTPGSNLGKITWAIEIPNEKLVDIFKFSAMTETFQNGNIKWTIIGITENNSVRLEIHDSKAFETRDLKNATKITITAELSQGNGETAWQHAQLFRQSLNNKDDYSMLVSLTLQNK